MLGHGLVGVVDHAVYAELDLVFGPFHGIDMKIAQRSGDLLPSAVDHPAGSTGVEIGLWGVNGAEYLVGLVPPVFHDVELAAIRPGDGAIALCLKICAAFVDVLSKHPDGWPCAYATGDLGPDLDTPVGKGEF